VSKDGRHLPSLHFRGVFDPLTLCPSSSRERGKRLGAAAPSQVGRDADAERESTVTPAHNAERLRR